MLNNLFNYATSELSQDAFICWLLSYIHKDASWDDENLRDCARDLIVTFFEDKVKIDRSEIQITEIKRQYNRIDVFVVVNDKFGIIIEDKIFSYEGENQLRKNKQAIENEPSYSHLKEILGVYYKTGFQSDYSNVLSEGYTVVDRAKILQILNLYVNKIKNEIFLDYYSCLKYMQDIVASFELINIDNWNNYQVFGFYDFLMNSLFVQKIDSNLEVGYRYVPNQAGGFVAMWFIDQSKYEYEDFKYYLYLQLEFKNRQMNICLKVKVLELNPKSSLKNIRSYLVEKKKKTTSKTTCLIENGFIKPTKYGTGKTMTLGIYDCEHDSYLELYKNVKSAFESFKEYSKNFECIEKSNEY